MVRRLPPWIRAEAPPGVPRPTDGFLGTLRSLNSRLSLKWDAIVRRYVVVERGRDGIEAPALTVQAQDGSFQVPDMRVISYLQERNADRHGGVVKYVDYLNRLEQEEAAKKEEASQAEIRDKIHYYSDGLRGVTKGVLNPSDETKRARAGTPERLHERVVRKSSRSGLPVPDRGMKV